MLEALSEKLWYRGEQKTKSLSSGYLQVGGNFLTCEEKNILGINKHYRGKTKEDMENRKCWREVVENAVSQCIFKIHSRTHVVRCIHVTNSCQWDVLVYLWPAVNDLKVVLEGLFPFLFLIISACCNVDIMAWVLELWGRSHVLKMVEEQERKRLGSDTMEHHTRSPGLPISRCLLREKSSSLSLLYGLDL